MLLLSQSEYDFIKESNEIESEVGVDFEHIEALMFLKALISLNKAYHVPLDEDTILTLHKKLMVSKLLRFAGEYRQTPVGIYQGSTLIKQMPNPAVVPALMDGWIKEFNEMKKTPWELHKEFENIHPFVDGNGRTGRLLWAFDKLRRSQSVYPMLNDFVEEDILTPDYIEYQKSSRQSFSGNTHLHYASNTFNSKRNRYYKALD